MNKYQKVEISEEIKNYWAFKEIAKNYTIELKHKVFKDKNKYIVRILFEDGDLYELFQIVEIPPEKELRETENFYMVYDRIDEALNDDLEDTTTLEACVKSCLYYFWSRY